MTGSPESGAQGTPAGGMGDRQSVVLTFDSAGAPSLEGSAPDRRARGLEIHLTPVLEGGHLVGLRIAFPDRRQEARAESHDRVILELGSTLDELESTNNELQVTILELEARVRELTTRNDSLHLDNEDLRQQLGNG